MPEFRLLRSAVLAWLVGLVIASAVHAASVDGPVLSRVWARPPVSFRAGYTLDAGQVLISYQFERIGKSGLLVGPNQVGEADVYQAGFASSPIEVDLDRHVFSLAWSPAGDLTLRFDLPFVRNVSSNATPGSGSTSFSMEADGFGDVETWVLYRVFRDDMGNVHLSLGLSLPSGSINETQVTMLSAGQLTRLPYPLQLGSGTVDLMPGFTYRGRYAGFEWGGQAIGTLRAGANSADYTLGNEYEIGGYGGFVLTDWLTPTFGLRWQQWFAGTGADPLIDPTTSPMADPTLQAGRRLDAIFGLSITPTGGRFSKTRVALDAGLPAFQDLDGPQPRATWRIGTTLEVQF